MKCELHRCLDILQNFTFYLCNFENIFGSVQLSMKSLPVIAYGLLLFFDYFHVLHSPLTVQFTLSKTLESAKHVIFSDHRRMTTKKRDIRRIRRARGS